MQLRDVLRILVFGQAALLAAPATAMVWSNPPASYADVVAAADRVYRGRVTTITYGGVPGPAGQTVPYTQVEVRVETAYKGTAAGALENVYVFGGRFANAAGRRLLVPGLPTLAVGERVVLFVNHATFPFTGAVWGATGVLRVAQTGDGPVHVLTHAWQPVAIVASNILVRPEVRCATDPKRRDRCTGWLPTASRTASPEVEPVPLPKGVATLAQFEDWLAARVEAGGRPAAPSVVKRAEVEELIGSWIRRGGRR